MSTLSMVARRYAKALFSLASEVGEVARIEKELDEFVETLKVHHELRSVLENPAISTTAKKRIVSSVLAQMGCHRHLISTVKLLLDRRRFGILTQLQSQYKALARQEEGHLQAEVVTAVELPEAYYAQIQEVLSLASNRKVSLIKRIDPSLIGGVVVRVGDAVFDGSIRSRLNGIKQEIFAKTSTASV
ncbi:MAG: ATP synthase F1 subunit delta [Deltaproteobacteria bacterium]|nr:ATP synthase F1 subunit delta [Deltaproteobacteria bacterium]